MPHTPKAPAFQLYVRDWISSQSLTLMSIAAEGTYIRLLCYQWLSDDGLLPGDPKALRALTKCSPPEWRRVWLELEPHFPVIEGGKRANPRLLGERRARDVYREEQRAKAAKGNRSRWGGDSGNGDGRSGDRPAIPEQSQEQSPDDRSAFAFASAEKDQLQRSTAREPLANVDNSPRDQTGISDRLTDEGRTALDALLRRHPSPPALLAELGMILGGGRPNVPSDPALVSLALADLRTDGGPVSGKRLRIFVQGAQREAARAEAPTRSSGDETADVLARAIAGGAA